MSPLQIRILFDIYENPGPVDRRTIAEVKAYDEAIEMFEAEKLIEALPVTPGWMLTDRGQAYVAFMLALPFPTCTWKVPDSWSSTWPRGAK